MFTVTLHVRKLEFRQAVKMFDVSCRVQPFLQCRTESECDRQTELRQQILHLAKPRAYILLCDGPMARDWHENVVQ